MIQKKWKLIMMFFAICVAGMMRGNMKVVLAEETYGTYENLRWGLNGDHIIIYGLDKDIDTEAVIPSEINGKPVKEISNLAFDRCTNLISISIPEGVEKIYFSTFNDCSRLKSIEIPASCTEIEEGAFKGCSGSLESIKVAEGNERYESKNCNLLIDNFQHEIILGCKNSTFPELSEKYFWEIGIDAFYGCEELTHIEIPDYVEIIGRRAFAGCSGLKNISISKSVILIDNDSFMGCSNLESIIVSAENEDYKSVDNTIIKIDEEATNYLTLILGCKNSTIPNYVKYIGDYAFCGCIGLTSITIPESVIGIGKAAFSGCSGVETIEIPKDITRIEQGVFSGCSGLKTIEIPKNVTSIGEYAFSGCSGVETIEIPKDITHIEQGVFCGCDGLTEITIPEGVTSIGAKAFLGCDGLTEITIPESVTSIGSRAFYECTGLTEVVVPSKVEEMGGLVFALCSNLKKITLLSPKASLHGGMGGDDEYYIPMFDGCSSLEEINVVDNHEFYTSVDGVLYSKDKTRLITYPPARGKVYTIPDNVTNIGEEGDLAFAECCLDEIVLPSNLKGIFCDSFENVPYGDDSRDHKIKVTVPENMDVSKIVSGLNVYDSSVTEDYLGGIEKLRYKKYLIINVAEGSIADKYLEQYKNDITVVTYPTKKSEEIKAAAAKVDELISAIGTVTIDSKSKIDAARKAYDELSSDAKAKVTKYDVLTAAEKKLSELENAKEAGKTNETDNNKDAGNTGNESSKNNTSSATEEQKVTAPAKVTISSAKNSKKKSIVVKWKKVKNAKGYEVQYALNSKFTKSKKSKSLTKVSFTAKKLKKGKTYYVRVRAYKKKADGTKVNGKWSKVKKVKIKK